MLPIPTRERDVAAFSIASAVDESVATIALHGELDLAVEAELDEQFERIRVADPAVVVVDLRGLTFMDGRGVNALVRCRRRCERQGRHCVLVRGRPSVQRLFVLTKTERLFDMVGRPADVDPRAYPARGRGPTRASWDASRAR